MPSPTLPEIVRGCEAAMAARRAALPLAELKAMALESPAPRGFAAALRAGARPAVIAEIKQASPSGGMLRPDFEAGAIARAYEAAGAAAISVLTEEAHFLGSLERLCMLRGIVSLPLLRKDFLTEPYQLYEARYYGADAVLLIAAILEDGQLQELAGLASELGLDVLLEVHDSAELERALAVPTPMLGINNRNLKTYAIDLDTTGRLIAEAGDRLAGRVVVGESGIRTREDVARLVEAGAEALLVGESLMRQPEIGEAYAALFGGVDAAAR
ncbi:MAG: indole-3-glycerol phosphate synthase TrpC [Candidatus Sericytochromatia bacterium]